MINKMRVISKYDRLKEEFLKLKETIQPFADIIKEKDEMIKQQQEIIDKQVDKNAALATEVAVLKFQVQQLEKDKHRYKRSNKRLRINIQE